MLGWESDLRGGERTLVCFAGDAFRGIFDQIFYFVILLCVLIRYIGRPLYGTGIEDACRYFRVRFSDILCIEDGGDCGLG